MENSTTTTGTPEQRKGGKGNVYKAELHKYRDAVQPIEGFNRRKDMGDLDELARSIAENGVRVPASGYFKNGTWYVRNGNRRLAASLIAIEKYGAEVVFPIIADPQGYTEAEALVDMLTQNSGKPLTMLEESTVVKDLEALGLTEAEISKRTGKTVVAVRNLLNLTEATPEVKEMIEAGTVAASTVVEMQRDFNPEEVQERINDAVQETGKAKVTAKDIKGAKSGRERIAKSKDPDAERERQAGLPPEEGGETAKAKPGKVKTTNLDVSGLKAEIEAAITERGGEWNMFSRRLLVLLENYAKGAVTFDEVLTAFVDSSEG